MIGQYASVNSSGDLHFSADVRPIIHQIVFVNKKCKSGLYEVIYESKKYYVAKRNLDIINKEHFGVEE
jgi:hypothetical protein